MNESGKILITFLAALVVAGSSLAEDTGAANLLDLSVEDLMKVKITTASKKSELSVHAPATVYVISKNDIRSRGYVNLKDVLRDLPGMEAVENYFSEQGTLVPVRGVVGNNKIVVLLNGVRLNPPGGEDIMLRSDMSVRFAEQIEVIYGPGSTLYGQDAISAVINIITKKSEQHTAVEALGSVGTNSYADSYASLATPIELDGQKVGGVTAYAQVIDSQLDNLKSEYSDWWSNYQSIAAATGQNGKPVRHDHGENFLLRAENETSSAQLWYRDSWRSSSEGGFAPVLQYIDEAKWHDNELVGELRNKQRLSENANLTSSLSYNRYEIDPETRYVFPVSADALNLNDYKYGLGQGVTLEETFDWKPIEKLTFIGGVVAQEFDVTPKASIPGGADTDGDIVSQAGYFSYYTELGNPASRVDVSRAVDLHYHNYAVFLEGNYSLNDEWFLIAGGRFDSNSRFSSVPFSPRASLVYSDVETHITAKYIFSKAYVAPAPYYGYNVFDNGQALNVANPDLSPERATSNEISLAWNTQKWLVGLDAYYNQQSNLLLVGDLALPQNVISDAVYLDPAGTQRRILTHTVNEGNSTARGFDLFSRYGDPELSMWASYSFVDYNSKFGSQTSYLPQISRNNYRLGVTWHPIANLAITPSLVARSTPANVSNSAGLGREIRAPYEINLYALYTPLSYLDLFLGIRNLTDHKYALKGIQTPTPQEGFSLRGGVQVRF